MSTYRQYHDAFMNIVDEIAHEANEAQRLRYLRDLLEDAKAELVRQRNLAAYELRLKTTADNAAAACGISRDKLSDWIEGHRARTGAPAVPRFSIDLSAAKNLSAGGRFPSSHQH